MLKTSEKGGRGGMNWGLLTINFMNQSPPIFALAGYEAWSYGFIADQC